MTTKNERPEAMVRGQITQPYHKRVAKRIDDTVVFNFPDGIPAFEDSKRFILAVNDKIKPFFYFKSLDVKGLSFVCIDPFLVCRGYSVKLAAKDQSLLGLKDVNTAFVLALVTVEKDPRNTTANLLAPIVINMENLCGRQVILDENFPVRFNIWAGLEAQDREEHRDTPPATV
ncbi:MAG: flagellar assembly protein FliW [Victivallales bacterium]|nr:flagellar assembly protein FliW [Victivallales bacterium]